VNFSIADNDLVSLTKSFTPTAVLQGQPFTLSFTLSSPAETATATGRITSTVVNFTDVLPTSLIAVGGTPTLSGSCLGTTPPIAANAISIGISGIQVAAGPPTGNGAATVSCVVSVPVIAAPGQVNASCAANPPVFTNSATNISTLTNAINAVVPSCVVVGAATSLSVSKSNSPTTALLAGSSTTYTVTYTNNGPGIANNALISDTPSPGLSACTVLSCTPTGGASCPALTLLDANLFTGGTPLLAFPANSSVSLQVRCGVTATGLP
jgi:uncharacterized repeat protein (TIGR01451 family)